MGTPGFERLLMQTVRHCTLTDTGYRTGRGRDASDLIAGLLEHYRMALGELDLIEPDWIAPLLSAETPKIGFVAFLRFTSFSEAQLSMLLCLAEKNTACAALTWEDGFAPTRANDAAAKALLVRADEIRTAQESPGDSELDAVATGIHPAKALLAATGSVVLGEARGREAEAALVAEMAAAAVRRGTSPERVAVAFGDLAPRVDLVRGAMAAEGLECSFDCPLTVGATPFGRALAALLRLATGRGARADALQFLQGPFSDSDPRGVLQLDSKWRTMRQTEDSSQILRDVISLGGSTGAAAAIGRTISRKAP